MTRQEFIDEVQSYDDLKEFCYQEGCSICDNIFSSDERNVEIENWIVEALERIYWYDIRDKLITVPEGFGYYQHNGDCNWEGLNTDSDFEAYKTRVMVYMDADDSWDSDEQEQDEEIEASDIQPEQEDISLDELFITCRNQIHN